MNALLRLTVTSLAAACLLGLGFANAAAAPPAEDIAGRRVSVEARIGYGGGDPYQFASHEPGEFAVPDGYRAVNFRYAWGDPTSGRESNKLGPNNIVPIKGWVPSDIGAGSASLGPGTYRFVVGGMPGAMGTLSFMLVKADDPRVGGKTFRRTIDVVTWLPEYPQYKGTATYVVEENGVVTGTSENTWDYSKMSDQTYVVMEPMRMTGTFRGTAAGNVMTGTWNEKHHPHRLTWRRDGNTPEHFCTDSGNVTNNARLVLYADGTLSETCRGASTWERQWSGSAPGDLAGKRDSWNNEFTIPSKDIPSPITGTWKDRGTGTNDASPGADNAGGTKP